MDVTAHHISSSGTGSLRLRLITRIALGTAITAFVLLAISMLFFADERGMSYTQLVQSHSLTHHNLGTALIIAGLFLTLCIGVISWLLALYGSFRVAGPLFRFSRNLEQASSHSKLPGVRKGDCYQDVSTKLQETVEVLHRQHDDVLRLLNQADSAFRSDKRDAEYLKMTLTQLKETSARVQID